MTFTCSLCGKRVAQAIVGFAGAIRTNRHPAGSRRCKPKRLAPFEIPRPQGGESIRYTEYREQRGPSC